jgi:hypothetical protein
MSAKLERISTAALTKRRDKPGSSLPPSSSHGSGQPRIIGVSTGDLGPKGEQNLAPDTALNVSVVSAWGRDWRVAIDVDIA